MMNENVVKVLKENLWDLATCANGEPNVVPVAFKDVTGDGRLMVADVFLETTLKNVRENGGKIAVSAYNAKTMEGYQIKGTAEYLSEGPAVDAMRSVVETVTKGGLAARGVLAITPEKVIVTSPSPEVNKKVL